MRWPWSKPQPKAAPLILTASERPAAPAMKISPSVAGHLQARQAADSNPFDIHDPLPGVAPAAVTKLAMDWAGGGVGQWAGDWGGVALEGERWLGYQTLAVLAQRPEYRAIVSTIAGEMTRKGIKITAKGDKDKSEKIAALEAAFRRFKAMAVLRGAIEYDGFYGRGQIFLDTGASGRELGKPLPIKPEKIGLGGLKAIRIIEPMWTYPGLYNSTDPIAPDFYRPRQWYVMGKPIHCDRFIMLVANPVADILKPTYQFGGLSRVQMLKQTVDNWMRTRQSVSDITHNFSVAVLKTNMSGVLTGGAGDDFLRRLDTFNFARDNQGVMALDMATEDFAFADAALGGLSDLQGQAQEQLSGYARIPNVKLWGIQPKGLNASSEGEIRVFYDFIAAENERLLRDPIATILNAIQCSEFGEIDPDIGFDFHPLWEASEKEVAEIERYKAETHGIFIDRGVIGNDEVRQSVAGDEASPYHGIDLSGPPPESEAELLAAVNGAGEASGAEATADG